MNHLDEQQRRWMAALEAKRIGHGGKRRFSQIKGFNINAIRRGRRELDSSLADRPEGRIR